MHHLVQACLSGAARSGDCILRIDFRRDESGLALTEYLVLLGLIASGVMFTVLAFGGYLGENWRSWSGMYQMLSETVPDNSSGP